MFYEFQIHKKRDCTGGATARAKYLILERFCRKGAEVDDSKCTRSRQYLTFFRSSNSVNPRNVSQTFAFAEKHANALASLLKV